MLYQYYSQFEKLTPEARRSLYKELMEYAKTKKEEACSGKRGSKGAEGANTRHQP